MISVQNRVPNPGQEGRVLITPETGAPFYATLAMADGATQPGTPWNRLTGNLLQADIRSYPIASGQTVTAGQVVDVVASPGPTATVSVGQTVNLLRNGQLVPHIVVHIGNPSTSLYDDSCNGVWVLRQDITALGAWNASGANALPGSTIMTAMQNSVQEYDPSIQSAIKTVKIPYCVGNSSATVNSLSSGLSCKIFPLGGYELGWTTANNQYFPVDGAVLDYFSGTSDNDQKRAAYFKGAQAQYLMRSPMTNSDSSVWRVSEGGGRASTSVTITTIGYREAFILPTGTVFNEDGTVSVQQQITTSGTPSQAIALQSGSAGDVINVIFSGMAELSGVTQGQQITSPGVQGFGAMDEWLSVFPGWLFSTINESAVKIATGSYTGTGTHGADNPVVITSPFSGIKALLVSAQITNQYCSRLVLVYGQTSAGSSDYNRTGVFIDWSAPGKVSFYNSSYADAQMNTSGITYFYAIFGFEVTT